jgi:hypothetical protein
MNNPVRSHNRLPLSDYFATPVPSIITPVNAIPAQAFFNAAKNVLLLCQGCEDYLKPKGVGYCEWSGDCHDLSSSRLGRGRQRGQNEFEARAGFKQ